LAGWQLFVHRGGSWTNPLSSDAVTPVNPSGNASQASGIDNSSNNTVVSTGITPVAAVTPDAVRLVLSLPPGPTGSGSLTLDWVNPTLSGTAS
jgi:general secretion pathway protein J